MDFVRIRDAHLAEEFSLSKDLPTLVYFRHGIPVVFYGDLEDGDDVFDFIFENMQTAAEKSEADEEDQEDEEEEDEEEEDEEEEDTNEEEDKIQEVLKKVLL